MKKGNTQTPSSQLKLYFDGNFSVFIYVDVRYGNIIYVCMSEVEKQRVCVTER